MTLTPEALEGFKRRYETWQMGTDYNADRASEWCMENLLTLIKALEDRDAEIERLRPEVLSFAKLMEAALSAKDGVRGGNSWQKNTLALEILQHNLREKMDECEGKLKAAQCAANRGTEDGLFMADIETHRAADLAVHMGNFAMMIADICGALDRAAMDGGA